MSLMARALPDNPVLNKELRVRMRGARSYWILLGYLGFLSLVLLTNYAAWLRNVSVAGVGGSEAASLGQSIFDTIRLTQMFLVLFITPALTSGALTIEREQQTMDLLTMTPLSRRTIIAGKLLAAVAFTALLLVASLPLVSVCFMLGSLDPATVVSTYLMFLFGSFVIGAMGLMWSAIAKTTTMAVMLTYVTLFCVFVLCAVAFAGSFSGGVSSTAFESAFRAVGVPWFGPKFLGVTLVEGAGFSVLSLLCGLAFAAVARNRIEMYPERGAGRLRLFTAFVLGVQVMAANLWWLEAWYGRGAGGGTGAIQPPLGALIVTASLLMLLVPVFATGDESEELKRDPAGSLRSGWTPKGLRTATTASALPYLLLLTVFALGLYALAFVVTGHGGDFARSGFASNWAAPAPGTAAAPPGRGGDFWQIALVTLAAVGGFALFCQFLSVAFRSRWVAWMLGTLLLGITYILPPFAFNAARSGDPAGLQVNFLYLNPAAAVYQASEPTQWGQHLLAGHTAVWLVGAGAWAALGLLSLVLTVVFARRAVKRG